MAGGMPKARVILKVDRGPNPGQVVVTVREHDWTTRTVTLADLSGAELMRAAANAKVGGGPGVNAADRRNAIAAKVWEPGFTPQEFVPHKRDGLPRRDPETPSTREETPAPMPEPEPEPNPYVGSDTRDAATIQHEESAQAGDASTAVAKAIAELMASFTPPAPSIDEEQVRGIVEQAVAGELDKIRESLPVHKIQMPECKIVDLPELSHEILPELIQAMGCNLAAQAGGATIQYPFLSGPAGSGKSTVITQAAAAHGLETIPMSLSPDMLRTQLFGFIDGNGKYHTTPFRMAYEQGMVLILDEMDKGNAGILGGLNQGLAGTRVYFPDAMVDRHDNFLCLSTGNTFGLGPDAAYVGNNRLDAATLDRFVTFYMGYDLRLEWSLAMGFSTEENHATIAEWIDTARRYRRNAEEHRVEVVIGPRSIQTGAAYIAAGMSIEQAAERTIFAPMSADTRARVQGV